MKRGLPFLLTILALAVLASCSGETMMGPFAGQPVIVSTAPAPGATNVPLDASFTVRFSTAMDRASVERNLRLWRMMGLMGEVPGHFGWNEGGTECTFMPDSLLAPHTLYRMHAGHDMRSRNGEHMGHDGGMMMGGMMGAEGDMEWDCTTGER